jgi:hypothetical protein
LKSDSQEALEEDAEPVSDHEEIEENEDFEGNFGLEYLHVRAPSLPIHMLNIV